MAGPWLACTGSPVLLMVVLYTPVHSLIGQRLQLWSDHPSLASHGAAWSDKPQRCMMGTSSRSSGDR
jgi:hypothetical protein